MCVIKKKKIHIISPSHILVHLYIFHYFQQRAPYIHIQSSEPFVKLIHRNTQHGHNFVHTHAHTNTNVPAVVPAPNALTSSFSPLLPSSPPPSASLGLKWSQESNTATMNCAAGERAREKAWDGERDRELRKTRTLYSRHPYSAARKKMSFWLDTKEPLYPSPRSSIFFSPIHPTLSLSLSLSLTEIYFPANDLIRGAI